MLYVFAGTDRLTDDFVETCACFLPPWRLKQVMSYKFLPDRKSSALVYLMLVYALKNEGFFKTLPEFGYPADGKPYLTNYPGLFFNLSHCRDAAACLLSDREVGVDVEKVGEYDDGLARAICNEPEYQWVTSFSDPGKRAKRVTALWTRKESLVKWLGMGLEKDPREIPSGILSGVHHDDCHISTRFYRSGNFYLSACSDLKKQQYHGNKKLPFIRQPERNLLRMGKRQIPDTVQSYLSL